MSTLKINSALTSKDIEGMQYIFVTPSTKSKDIPIKVFGMYYNNGRLYKNIYCEMKPRYWVNKNTGVSKYIGYEYVKSEMYTKGVFLDMLKRLYKDAYLKTYKTPNQSVIDIMNAYARNV